MFTAALHLYQRVDAGFPTGFVDGAHCCADEPVLALLLAVDALAPPEISRIAATATNGREGGGGESGRMVDPLL